MSEYFYSIIKIDEHLLNKEKILFKISKINSEFKKPSYSISNTDWNLERDDWFSFSFSKKDQSKIINKIFQKRNGVLSVPNAWFNQYYPKSGSTHPFHIHEDADYIGIYFVELENPLLTTVLIDPITKKEVRPRINEGDMLICSGDITHMSPPNHTDSRKTVVSFNFQFK